MPCTCQRLPPRGALPLWRRSRAAWHEFINLGALKQSLPSDRQCGESPFLDQTCYGLACDPSDNRRLGLRYPIISVNLFHWNEANDRLTLLTDLLYILHRYSS